MDEIDALDQCEESALYRAIVMQCWQDATCQNPSAFGGGGRTSAAERDEARRFLLSPVDPWREDRGLICTLAGYEVSMIEQRAREVLNPMLAAEREAEAAYIESGQERAKRLALLDKIERQRKKVEPRKPAPKPAPPQWSAAQFLDWACANEDGLRELGELQLALEEASRLEANEIKPMEPRRENAHAKRYIETDISAIAAE
jgi:hypothetical protein